MSETELYAQILAAHSVGSTRLMRMNAGLAWQGTVVKRTPATLVLANPRPVKLGPEGLSDLIGWTTYAMINSYNLPTETEHLMAQFVAIECKYGARKVTEAQANFLELVRRMGGRAGVARSVDDAGRIIRGEL